MSSITRTAGLGKAVRKKARGPKTPESDECCAFITGFSRASILQREIRNEMFSKSLLLRSSIAISMLSLSKHRNIKDTRIRQLTRHVIASFVRIDTESLR